jgi:hypothetical protein
MKMAFMRMGLSAEPTGLDNLSRRQRYKTFFSVN